MRVLSGIQPTGRPHWGNYFGAIRQYIDLQGNDQSYYFIANLHALTTVRDYLVLALVAAPFVSAYLAHHHALDYRTALMIHMLVGDLVIALIPFTKLGHMPFIILNRVFTAGEYAWKPGNRRWQAHS